MKTVAVRILPRNEVLDTQGRAVQRTLERHGKHLAGCRIGKYVELQLEGSDDQVLKEADEIARFVLHNPLIETYQLEILN
jgi:phosphoribosylformylglycinamidine synthase PurS subunit